MGCCDGLGRRVRLAGATIAGGVQGLSRAAMLSEPPSPGILAQRARQCFGDPDGRAQCNRLSMGLVCRECGCLAVAKIRVASEACPLGRWGAEASVRPQPPQARQGSRRPIEPPQV